jgi:hypothetical protein
MLRRRRPDCGLEGSVIAHNAELLKPATIDRLSFWLHRKLNAIEC